MRSRRATRANGMQFGRSPSRECNKHTLSHSPLRVYHKNNKKVGCLLARHLEDRLLSYRRRRLITTQRASERASDRHKCNGPRPPGCPFFHPPRFVIIESRKPSGAGNSRNSYISRWGSFSPGDRQATHKIRFFPPETLDRSGAAFQKRSLHLCAWGCFFLRGVDCSSDMQKSFRRREKKIRANQFVFN